MDTARYAQQSDPWRHLQSRRPWLEPRRPSRLPDHLIDEIRARLPIEVLVGSTVVRKRSGRRRTALCPFHEEKTPSFTVLPDTGTFHCFGCSAHGDVFAWTMRRRGCDFRAAIVLCAAEAGIALDPTMKLPVNEPGRPAEMPALQPGSRRQNQAEPSWSADLAQRLWREAVPAEGTSMATYLARRALQLEPGALRAFSL